MNVIITNYVHRFNSAGKKYSELHVCMYMHHIGALLTLQTSTTKPRHIILFLFSSHNLLDSKINTLLSMCQDPDLLNPVHGIVQSVVYHEESPPQYQPSYLQSKHSLHLHRLRAQSPVYPSPEGLSLITQLLQDHRLTTDISIPWVSDKSNQKKMYRDT